MVTIAELTAQVVALTDQVQTLTSRIAVAEHNVTMSAPRTGGSNDSGIFDTKRPYPKELKENTSFRAWSERFIAWLAMDNEEIARAFHRAGKQEQPFDVSGLSDPRRRTQVRCMATCVHSLRDTARLRRLFGSSKPTMVSGHGVA